MRIATDSPPTVRGAGVLVALQGLAGLAFAAAVLVKAFGGGSTPGNNLFGEAAYFIVLAGGVAACGVGLLLGKRWSRSPAIVIELLLLMVAWYATGPSARPEYGVPVGVVSIVVLVLLFGGQARDWYADEPAAEDTDSTD